MPLRDLYWDYHKRPFWRRVSRALSKTSKYGYKGGNILKRFFDMKLCHPNMRNYHTNYSLKSTRKHCLPLHRVLNRGFSHDM